MGEAINELNARHIQQTINLMYNVSTLFLIIMCIGYIVITKYQELSL